MTPCTVGGAAGSGYPRVPDGAERGRGWWDHGDGNRVSHRIQLPTYCNRPIRAHHSVSWLDGVLKLWLWKSCLLLSRKCMALRPQWPEFTFCIGRKLWHVNNISIKKRLNVCRKQVSSYPILTFKTWNIYFVLLNSTEASGEVTLRTTQFLDKLRENPALKIMRDELVSMLQDNLEKIGIPPVCTLKVIQWVLGWIKKMFSLFNFNRFKKKLLRVVGYFGKKSEILSSRYYWNPERSCLYYFK